MKKITLLSLAATLALSTPARSQPPAATPNDLFKGVQTHIQQKKYSEAIAEVERVLALPDLPATERARFLRAAAQAAMSQGRTQIPTAIAFHERIVGDAEIPNTAKIEALNSVADAQIRLLDGLHLFEMDLSKAHATLQRALELPNLTAEERALALTNIGKLHARQDNFEQARATYQQILALEVSERTKQNAQRAIADTYVSEGNAEAAIALYRQHNFEMVGLYQRLGDAGKNDEEIYKLLDDASTPENTRWNQFTRLSIWPTWNMPPGDMAALRKAWETYMPTFLEKDANRAAFLQRAVLQSNVRPEFIIWAAPLVLQAPKLSAADTLNVKSALVEALAAQGNLPRAAKEAETIASDERFAAISRLWAQLVAQSTRGANKAALAGTVQAASTLSNKEKADAIIRATKTLLRGGNESAGKALYAYHQSLLAAQPRASITAEYSANAPYDVGSWLASPLLKANAGKAKLDRPYGDNLEFLLTTDSAMTGRNTSAQAGQATGDNETDFHTATDAEGIHFFFHAYDSKVAEVVAGLTGGGSFEMYLAPGEQQAYHTFLIDMPRGGTDPNGFITMYPDPTFRRPSIEDGSFRTQTRATDKGFATHLFLAWELFYDKLPGNGDKWQFEAIRWARAGGFSFGGSESVHHRSSFGDVVFSGLTPQSMNAIKRGIIFKAVAKYKRLKHPTRALGMWADPELADREFYLAKVEPLLTALDAHAEKVNRDMSDADVEFLFRQAVPGWMDAQFQIEAMRAEYLKAKQLQG